MIRYILSSYEVFGDVSLALWTEQKIGKIINIYYLFIYLFWVCAPAWICCWHNQRYDGKIRHPVWKFWRFQKTGNDSFFQAACSGRLSSIHPSLETGSSCECVIYSTFDCSAKKKKKKIYRITVRSGNERHRHILLLNPNRKCLRNLVWRLPNMSSLLVHGGLKKRKTWNEYSLIERFE